MLPALPPPRYRVINPSRHVRVINPLRRLLPLGRQPVGSLVPFLGRTSNRPRFEVVEERSSTGLVRSISSSFNIGGVKLRVLSYVTGVSVPTHHQVLRLSGYRGSLLRAGRESASPTQRSYRWKGGYSFTVTASATYRLTSTATFF